MISSACRSSTWCTRWGFASSTNSVGCPRSASRRRTASGIPQRSLRRSPQPESSAIRSPRTASSDLPLTAMLEITVGALRFTARWEADVAPKTCAAFRRLLPLRARLVQARWSGESAWIPLGDLQTGLGYENHTSYPAAGQLLLYPGGTAGRQPFRHDRRGPRAAGRVGPPRALRRRSGNRLQRGLRREPIEVLEVGSSLLLLEE